MDKISVKIESAMIKRIQTDIRKADGHVLFKRERERARERVCACERGVRE